MKKLSDKASKQKGLHEKIEREILPSFAEKLKKEAVISAYDRQSFKIPLLKGQPPFTIKPDLVMRLPNGEKVLVEIANPRDPKRFLGELIYPSILRYHKKIAKAIIFVLHDRERQEIHDRGFGEIVMLSQIFGNLTIGRITSWPLDEQTAYHNLKYILKRFLNGQ